MSTEVVNESIFRLNNNQSITEFVFYHDAVTGQLRCQNNFLSRQEIKNALAELADQCSLDDSDRANYTDD